MEKKNKYKLSLVIASMFVLAILSTATALMMVESNNCTFCEKESCNIVINGTKCLIKLEDEDKSDSIFGIGSKFI